MQLWCECGDTALSGRCKSGHQKLCIAMHSASFPRPPGSSVMTPILTDDSSPWSLERLTMHAVIAGRGNKQLWKILQQTQQHYPGLSTGSKHRCSYGSNRQSGHGHYEPCQQLWLPGMSASWVRCLGMICNCSSESVSGMQATCPS